MDKNQITDRMLLINEAVTKLKHFSQIYGINSIFIVGDYCRSAYLNRVWETDGLDVASAYEHQSTELGGLFASEIINSVPQFNEKTGTASVQYTSKTGKIRIEFQGKSSQDYMYNEEVKNWLQKQQVEDIPILHNIYGRDFTINSLAYSLHSENLYDLLDTGTRDFERKKIVTILPPDMIVKYNPIVVLRAIQLSLLYDFTIQDDFENLIPKSVDLLTSSVSIDRILQEVIKILKIDGRKSLKLMKRYGLHKLLLHEKVRSFLQ